MSCLPRNILPLTIITNIKSYLVARVSRDSSSHIHFDSDAVEIILDSGCSYTIYFYREDYISFKPSEGQLEEFGIHKIKDKGTVKYTVIDNNCKYIYMLI